nr:hypothetical protein CFP56_07713 [Quercus suber]
MSLASHVRTPSARGSGSQDTSQGTRLLSCVHSGLGRCSGVTLYEHAFGIVWGRIPPGCTGQEDRALDEADHVRKVVLYSTVPYLSYLMHKAAVVNPCVITSVRVSR